ncbi:terpene synthase family protein [Colletotrichum incanum]|nr:terpene synthase family protein [Colletotrichum incanum]
MAVAHTESAQLASRLDSRVMVIPDLRRMISHWPSGKNVHASEIEGLINVFLEKCDAPPQDVANVTEANPTLLASWEKLGTLTLMVLWQGRLDDYIEALEYESQAKAKEFRGKTKEYIAQYLQLSEGPKEPATTPVISDFQPVAKMICQQYDKDQCRRLRVSLFEYIDSTVQEMRYIESGEVPTDLKYEMLRKKTGGTGPLCALAEFASGLQWPSFVFDSHPYKMMLQSVAIIVGLTNDLLSLRKELRKGRTLSVVPVRVWNSQDGDLEAVIREVVDEIKKAVRQFDVCERRLINQSQADADATRQIAATLKTICTGNLNWSLVSKRYNVGEPAADGSLRQELRVGG